MMEDWMEACLEGRRRFHQDVFQNERSDGVASLLKYSGHRQGKLSQHGEVRW